MWRPEPEGETDTLETKLVSNGVEGVHVDLDGRAKRQEKVKKLRARNEQYFGWNPTKHRTT